MNSDTPATASPHALAITGLGVVAPHGIGRTAFADALKSRRVGVGELTLFEAPADTNCDHAAEVGDYDWTAYLRTKQAYADRVTQLSLGAARLALDDAGQTPPAARPAEERATHTVTGICFGSRFSCIETEGKFFEPVIKGTPKLASGLFFSHAAPNVPAAFCAVELGLTGYSSVYAGDNDAGRRALVSASRAVERGASPMVLAGAADALTPPIYRHFAAIGRLPDTRDRNPPAHLPDDDVPDKQAKALWGKVPGEAAVFVLIEREADAKARGAKTLGRWDDSKTLVDAFDAARSAYPHSWIFGEAGAAKAWLSALGGGFLTL